MLDSIDFDESLRPAGGDGDVTVSHGGKNLRFSWQGGNPQSVTVEGSGTQDSYSGVDVRMRCKVCVVVSPTGTEYCFTRPCAEWQ